MQWTVDRRLFLGILRSQETAPILDGSGAISLDVLYLGLPELPGLTEFMPTKTEAVEVFRQFAWSLAGKLAAPNLPRTAPPRPARPLKRGSKR